MRAAVVALGCLLATLPACGGGEPTVVQPSASPLPALAEQLARLPQCPPPPAAIPTDGVSGLHLPEEAVVASVRENGPLTQAQGFVALNPIQVREYYQTGDLELLHVEDEGFEAEVLVSDGDYRLFVKAQAFCAGGSHLVAVVAPEANAEAVPVPSGSPAPPAS